MATNLRKIENLKNVMWFLMAKLNCLCIKPAVMNKGTALFCIRVPTRTGNLEKWEGIFKSGKSQGILNKLEKSGKITQNTGNSGNLK